jgi:beta-glucosidase
MRSAIIASLFLIAPAGCAQTPKPLSAWDPQANELLAGMTLDEKIGQMTQADQQALQDLGDIRKYALGSLLSGGDSDPKAGNTLADWTEMVDRYQAAARRTRLGIPLLYGVDAVHGHNNVIGAVIFPHNIGLGCTRNPALVEKAARITAIEVRATGINWTFAPCVAVPRDIRWGRTYEGFSESPRLVAELGEAAVRGFQGVDLAGRLSVLATAKHYVGDGGTVFGTGVKKWDSNDHWPLDRGDVRLSEKELREIHMQGYLTAIRAGVATIMPSYSSWSGVKCSGSRRLLTGILKQELGFQGFLISDYAAIDELPGDYRSDVETSINAGMDMVMVPDKYVEFIRTLKQLVNDGKVPVARIDDAVRRILRAKFAMGLMDEGRRPQSADRSLHAKFGSREHRAVARDCVRQSLVLLKNGNRVLPLSKKARRIHIAGKNADDIGNQCGGWTIKWQGASGAVTSGGTTILAGIRAAVSPGTHVTFSRDGSGAAGAEAAIAVVGETPYAEMFGDRAELPLDREDTDVIGRLKQAGVPVVVVLVSGRPLAVDSVFDKADAFVAAWLPGTEGQGVADVLFGDYKPSGKLSFTWPQPHFTYGYGLSY